MGQWELKSVGSHGYSKGREIHLREAGERIGGASPSGQSGLGKPIREKRGSKPWCMVTGDDLRIHRPQGDLMGRRVLKLLGKEVYWDFNDTRFTEKLRECEGIDLSPRRR